jgi:hypothetical protein
MRAIDGHSVEWEEGYIRYLEWHRRVKDSFKWYSYPEDLLKAIPS